MLTFRQLHTLKSQKPHKLLQPHDTRERCAVRVQSNSRTQVTEPSNKPTCPNALHARVESFS
jgi:hypothetical protein